MSDKGKNKTYDRENTMLQKQKYEIKKLKREKKQLQNMINDLKLSLFKNKSLEELVEKQSTESTNWHDKRISAKKKENWLCHECGRDYLEIVIINRADGPHYFRRCGNALCGHKTKLKKHDALVKGPIEERDE